MTVSAPVRDLLQLALGSLPRSQAEKDRSRALLRCAYRGRTRKVRLSIAVNARPIKTDIRIKELAPYLHDLLGDVTKRDAKSIARIVKRGVERRWKDSSVARAIEKSTKIDSDRAKVIARTEIARARTDVGLGKKRDSDKVLFTLGSVDKTCPKCRALESKVYTVRKAAGVIPVHPNCRCFWSDAPKGARVSNVFCATGEGGGVDPSCGANGPKQATTSTGATVDAGSKVSPKRSKQVLEDADRIKVDEELTHGGEPLEEDDYDTIESLLTEGERDSMDYEIDQARESYIDESLNDMNFDIDENDWAEENGWSDRDIVDLVKEDLNNLDDSYFDEGGPTKDDLESVLDEWYLDTRSSGGDAIKQLRKKLQSENAPDSLLTKVSDLRDTYEEEWEKGRKEVEESMRDSAREDLADSYEDDGSVRRDFLRNLRRLHADEPRFSGQSEERTYDVWGKDADESGDRSLYFRTSKGAEYQVWDQSRRLNATDLKWREIGFNDDSGSFSVTGAGNAVEVFSKVSASVVSLLKNKDYPVASFTAAEESRQRLYDRMVKTISSVLPEYSAFAHVVSGNPKRYIVVKKNKVDEVRALFAGQGGTTEVLANEETQLKDGQKLVQLEPELRDEWFTEAGWTETGDLPSLQERTR